MKKKHLAKLATGLFATGVFFAVTSAHAITYNFDDGTNQGWTVEFNNGDPLSPATWFDGVNYSGDLFAGLPPVAGSALGPPAPGAPIGAISGTSSLLPGDPGPGVISRFSSPVLAPEAMDSLSAQFTISSMESGLNPDIDVWGRLGYKKEGSDSYFWGLQTSLMSQYWDIDGVAPYWTPLTVNVTSGDMVNQLFVAISVSSFPLDGGTQNWVDDVFSVGGGTPPPQVPEPATILLFGTGLAGLVGSRIRKKKQQ